MIQNRSASYLQDDASIDQSSTIEQSPSGQLEFSSFAQPDSRRLTGVSTMSVSPLVASIAPTTPTHTTTVVQVSSTAATVPAPVVPVSANAVPVASVAPVNAATLAPVTPVSAATTTAKTTAPAINATSTAVPSWISSLSDAVVKTDMTAMGGTVTEAGLAKMVTDLSNELTANKATLSTNQFNDLKTVVANLGNGETANGYESYTLYALVNGNAANTTWMGGGITAAALGNLAVGSSATTLSELNGKWLLGTDLPSTTVTLNGSSSKISYSASSAALFGANGPSVNDINQGQLGDCYYLSSLAEVACQAPSILRNMITVNGNNTYGIAFHVNGQTEYVTVNNMLQSGLNSGANMWGTLLEKGYAELQAINITTGNSYSGNSFTAIGNGGAPEYALEAITGASQITDFRASGSAWTSATYNASLNSTGSQGGLSTASVLSILKADLAAGDDLVLASRTWSYSASGKTDLVANHAMSVVGIDAANGNVQIRNPWGTIGAGQNWDTNFEVSLSTLLADGDTITADNMGSTPRAPVAPVLANQTANQTAITGRAVSFTLAVNTFSDPNGEALTYKATLANGAVLPSWLTFNAATETFSGTAPTAAQAISLTVTAIDTDKLSVTDTFSLTLAAPKAPVVASQTAAQTWTEGKAVSFVLPAGTFIDPNGDALAYQVTQANGTALPSWLNFNTSTGAFTGTAPATAQTLSLKVTATDTDKLSISETFTANVVAPAPAPVIPKADVVTLTNQTANQTMQDGKAAVLSLAANTFTDSAGSQIGYIAVQTGGNVNSTAFLSFNSATDTFAGTVPNGVVGTSQVEVVAFNAAGSLAFDNFNINFSAAGITSTKSEPSTLQSKVSGLANAMSAFESGGVFEASTPKLPSAGSGLSSSSAGTNTSALAALLNHYDSNGNFLSATNSGNQQVSPLSSVINTLATTKQDVSMLALSR